MKKLLLTPGPVPVFPEIYEVLKEAVIHHRSSEFKEILGEIQKKLQCLFETENPVCVLSATGSGAMEACVSNILSPKDKVLCIHGGKFGHRWIDLCKAYHVEPIKMKLVSGEELDLTKCEEILKNSSNLKAVFMQHCETSTATLFPVKEVSELVHKHTEALMVVDAMTSIGAMDFFMDQWRIDLAITGSQKGCVSLTGLSLLSLSARAIQQSEKSLNPRYYFDIKKHLNALKKNETFFSSPTVLIKALNRSLDFFYPISEKQKRIQHSLKLQKIALEFSQRTGLEIFSKSPSPSVTAFKVPSGIDGVKLKNHLEENYSLVIGGGQDHLKGKIVRIGHMGFITEEDTIYGLKSILEAINDLKRNTFSQEAIESSVLKLQEI